MSRRSPRTIHGNGRRRAALASIVVVLLAILTALGAVGVGSDRVAAQETSGYSIVQGEECRPLEPVGNGDRSVEAFYDYRSPDTDPSGWYYAYGPARELVREDTSQVFLYRGSDGLSLVFLHDGVGSGTTSGGAVEADLSGVPDDGEWAVRDDDYDGQDDDEFDGGSSPHATWAWNEGNRTDGGAYTGLAEDDWEEITVEMAFNEDSGQYPYDRWNGDPEDNEIDSWIARSGDETYELDMDEPITIVRGSCENAATTESTDTTTTAASETADEGGSTTDGTNEENTSENGSGDLPIDVPSVPEVPDLSSEGVNDWVSGQVADMSAANPLGIVVLVFALFAIALVTLRR